MTTLRALRGQPPALWGRRIIRRDSGTFGRLALAYGLALVCGAGTAVVGLAWLHTGEARAVSRAPVVQAPPDDGLPFGPEPASDHLEVVRGELGSDETLYTTLTRMGIAGSTVQEITIGLRPVFDFRYAKAGDRFRLAFTGEGSVIDFEYRTSAIDGYRLYRVADRLVAENLEVSLLRRTEQLTGVVGSSVYNAIRGLGESGQLAHEFSELFAWDVDFSREVRPGDEFRILYERLYQTDSQGNEVYVRPGRILAAQYRGREVHTAIHYEWDAEHSGYYRPDGSALERQFLRAPVKYSRIASPFSWSRLHPILRVRRPHLGVDYAAPYGTPVWAVGDGEVAHVGRLGGLGKTVKIRHSNGYVSTYGHLQGYAESLRVGSRVKRKQVIGYVGASGLATGPHVHYDIRKDGVALNPAKLFSPEAPPIPEHQLAAFRATRDASLAELDPTSIAALGEAL